LRGIELFLSRVGQEHREVKAGAKLGIPTGLTSPGVPNTQVVPPARLGPSPIASRSELECAVAPGAALSY